MKRFKSIIVCLVVISFIFSLALVLDIQAEKKKGGKGGGGFKLPKPWQNAGITLSEEQQSKANAIYNEVMTPEAKAIENEYKDKVKATGDPKGEEAKAIRKEMMKAMKPYKTQIDERVKNEVLTDDQKALVPAKKSGGKKKKQ